MKLKRARASRRGRIEIIPMIDVMFFLLATFMIASLSMQHLNAVGVTLPQGAAAPQNLEKTVTITVQKGGQILLNKQPVSAASLTSALKAMALPATTHVTIAADTNAHHGDVVGAMLATRAAGITNLDIAVDRP